MVIMRLLHEQRTVTAIYSICLIFDLCSKNRSLSTSIVERCGVAVQPIIESSVLFVPRWHHIDSTLRPDPSYTRGH